MNNFNPLDAGWGSLVEVWDGKVGVVAGTTGTWTGRKAGIVLGGNFTSDGTFCDAAAGVHLTLQSGTLPSPGTKYPAAFVLARLPSGNSAPSLILGDPGGNGPGIQLGLNGAPSYITKDVAHYLESTSGTDAKHPPSDIIAAAIAQTSRTAAVIEWMNKVPNWAINTAYAVGQFRRPTGSSIGSPGLIAEVTAISGTGTSQATDTVAWPATVGATVVDNAGANQITWTMRADVPKSETVSLVGGTDADLTGLTFPQVVQASGDNQTTGWGTIALFYLTNPPTQALVQQALRQMRHFPGKLPLALYGK